MPTELVKRVNLDLLYAPFRDRCFQLVANCRAKGVDYYAISGTRTYAEQAKLYFQGRTAPGPVVTNARPGKSNHNFGIAIDFCPDKDLTKAGLQPDYSLASYELLASEAEKLDLESALRWKSFREGPHIQLPIGKRGLTPHLLHLAHEKGGMKEVFHVLDEAGPWFD